jgi:hypothetical protein
MNGRSITNIARHAPSIGAYNKGLLKVTFKARMVISVTMSHTFRYAQTYNPGYRIGPNVWKQQNTQNQKTPSDWCASMSFVSTKAA